ncbi:MAG: methyltransferase domain-containing protein [Pseudomonadota bacterium]
MARLVYDEDFYNNQSETSSRSACAVVPILLDLIGPHSVVDVGCGLGTWLAPFCEYGLVDILGIDGDYIDRKRLQIPEDCFLSMDLSNPISLNNRKFDLVLCLEVAEHIPEINASKLIDFITTLAPVVFFSAAIPGQGGACHVNEQWPDYWSELFGKQGYQIIDVVRLKIWEMAQVEPWYCQNSFIFVRESQLDRFPDLVASASRSQLPLRLVHPELFRRFASLEYIQSRPMAFTLLARLRRKVFRKKS